MSRIILRKLTTGDKDSVYDLLCNSKVMEFILPRRALTDREAQTWFTTELTRQSRVVVACGETDELIGFCSIRDMDGKLDFGYFSREKFWQQGYGTEACELAFSDLSETIDISQIQIFIAKENKASLAVAKKLNWLKVREAERDGESGIMYAIEVK